MLNDRGEHLRTLRVVDDFVIARNPDPASSLPYLLRLPLPLPRPVVLKARETWPRTAKVYCHRAESWPEGREGRAGGDLPADAAPRRDSSWPPRAGCRTPCAPPYAAAHLPLEARAVVDAIVDGDL